MSDLPLAEWRACMVGLTTSPSDSEAMFRLGLLHLATGQLDGSTRWYCRVLAVDGHHPGALVNAAILLASAQPHRALRLLRRSIAIAPELLAAVANLGLHSSAVGRLPDVVVWLDRARALSPHDTAIMAHLGGTLGDLGAPVRGMRMTRRSLALEPALPAALLGAATLANRLDQIMLSARLYRRSLAVAPGNPTALTNLRVALLESGDIDGALAAADALALATGTPEDVLNAAQLRVFDRRTSPERLLARLLAAQAGASDKRSYPQRPIGTVGAAMLPRIGILDDRLLARTTHATGVLPLMEGLAGLGLDLVFFTNLPPSEWDDATRAYLRCGNIVWTGAWSDDQVVETMRDAGIGILIDTISHLSARRRGVIARRAAPVQVAYAALCSSGSEAMDYVISDGLLLPQACPSNLSERIIRLPAGHLYRPMTVLPSPAETPPSSALGYVTFGSFNALAKIGDEDWARWARIMQLVPKSRLVIKASGLRDPSVRVTVAERLHKAGIEPTRLDLRSWTKAMPEHLMAIADVDLCLDPLPFVGITTTLEAMSMGVPVPTVKGHSLHSRFGEYIAHRVGATELIADSPDELVGLTVALAQDEQARRRYRKDLPQSLADSLISRPDVAAAALADALRIAWRRWQTGEPTVDINIR